MRPEKDHSVSTAPAFKIELALRDDQTVYRTQPQQTRDKDRLDFAFNFFPSLPLILQGGH